MDQNHEVNEATQASAENPADERPAQSVAAETPAAVPAAEATSDEAATAPARRRASRRVSAAAGEVVAAPTDAAEATPAEAPAASDAGAAASTDEAQAPKKRVSRARKKVESSDESEGAATAVAEAPEAAAEPSEQAAAELAKATTATRTRTTRSAASKKAAEKTEGAADAAAETADPATQTAATETQAESAAASEAQAEQGAVEDGDAAAPRRRTTRSRGRRATGDSANGTGRDGAQQAEGAENGESLDAEGADAQAQSTEGTEKPATDGQQNGAREGQQSRSSRTRQRERKRRGPNDDGEPDISDDDVLLPIAGILDVLDNYAFVRTSGYLPGTGDVYVSLGQVKKYGLRKGDAVVGAIRQPREGDGGGRQKYNAIVKVDSVNSSPADEQQSRVDFAALTPVHPNERIRLETDAAELGARVTDLFAPIGKGQRGLVIGPHESGKSTALRKIANAVAQNLPDAHLMLVLIDERPEDVTELQRSVNGEVIASTFDRPAEDHTTIAELAIERAKRLVELGHDVVLLIDSLTDLARAYNLAAPAAVRVPAGSLDAAAVFPVKRLLSAARNIENGGSLTIIATVSAQPDSRLDEALVGELEGVANMQVRLSGAAADRRLFPAIELRRSSTRNEALLTSDAEAQVMGRLRRELQGEGEVEALETVLQRLERTSSNVEFLAVTQRAQA